MKVILLMKSLGELSEVETEFAKVLDFFSAVCSVFCWKDIFILSSDVFSSYFNNVIEFENPAEVLKKAKNQGFIFQFTFKNE